MYNTFIVLYFSLVYFIYTELKMITLLIKAPERHLKKIKVLIYRSQVMNYELACMIMAQLICILCCSNNSIKGKRTER